MFKSVVDLIDAILFSRICLGLCWLYAIDVRLSFLQATWSRRDWRPAEGISAAFKLDLRVELQSRPLLIAGSFSLIWRLSSCRILCVVLLLFFNMIMTSEVTICWLLSLPLLCSFPNLLDFAFRDGLMRLIMSLIDDWILAIHMDWLLLISIPIAINYLVHLFLYSQLSHLSLNLCSQFLLELLSGGFDDGSSLLSLSQLVW